MTGSPHPLDLLHRNSPALHYLCDAAGVLQTLSGACERFLGQTADKVTGRTIESWLTEGSVSQARWRELRAGSSRGECDLPFEIELSRGEESSLWVEVRESPVDETAIPPGWVAGIMIDITSRRLRESQLMDAQRLENLGLLSAGIAHDLNNILSPILIAGSLLEPLAVDDRQRRMVKILQTSAERGSRIVRQILQFAHGSNTDRGPQDAKHVIRELVMVIEETFPRSIRIQQEIVDPLPTINANPTQLHQVLLNLAVNARDAMPEGGTLTVRASAFTLSEAPSNEVVAIGKRKWLRISIADTGTGMSQEQLSQSWAPFYTTKPAGRGTGLGLSSVRSLVAAHGGFVEVDSHLGIGTTFTVNLPTLPDEQPASILPNDNALLGPVPGRGERILVVDDEPSVREVIRETLGSRGYEILLASDGVDALAAINLNASSIALVITDVHMPHMTGDVLVNVLRRIAPDLPVLAISGHPNAPQIWNAQNQAKPDASLSKPFSGSVLVNAVKSLVARPRVAASPEADRP